jgi:phage protein D
MDGNTLNAKSHASRNAGTRRLNYGGALREFNVLADLAHQRTSVFVNGWSVADKSGLQYEATDSLMRGELNGDASGASLLSMAFGERKEALAHTVPLTAQEAQVQAESYFKMNARRFVSGRGICDADAALRVGGYVDLQSLGQLFSGKYYITEVRHIFDYANGMRTAFTCERPGIGRAG